MGSSSALSKSVDIVTEVRHDINFHFTSPKDMTQNWWTALEFNFLISSFFLSQNGPRIQTLSNKFWFDSESPLLHHGALTDSLLLSDGNNWHL